MSSKSSRSSKLPTKTSSSSSSSRKERENGKKESKSKSSSSSTSKSRSSSKEKRENGDKKEKSSSKLSNGTAKVSSSSKTTSSKTSSSSSPKSTNKPFANGTSGSSSKTERPGTKSSSRESNGTRERRSAERSNARPGSGVANGKSSSIMNNGYAKSSPQRKPPPSDLSSQTILEEDAEEETLDDISTQRTIDRIDEAEDEYPDDFEEYEDDFEEMSDDDDDDGKFEEESVRDSPRASTSSSLVPEVSNDAGNSLLLKRLEKPRTVEINGNGKGRPVTSVGQSSSIARPTTSASRTFQIGSSGTIDSESLMKSAEVYKKLRSEGNLGLEKVISVDFPPNRRSELYNKIVEDGVKAQRYTQTGEDNFENETQTDHPEVANQETQHPETFHLRVEPTPASHNPTRKTSTMSRPNQLGKSTRKAAPNLSQMNKFLDIAGRTMISLLSQNQASTSALFHMPMKSRFEFSTGFMEFMLPSVVASECHNTCICVHPTNKNRLAIAFYITKSSEAHQFLQGHSLIAEYNMDEQVRPKSIFATPNQVTSLCYSFDGRTALFAGIVDGSCVIWDLSESESTFDQNVAWAETKVPYIVRLPSYDTSFSVLEEKMKRKFTDKCDCPIIKVAAVESEVKLVQQQFVTFDSRGVVTIYGLSAVAPSLNFETDLGLRVGARLRLIKLSSATCCGPSVDCLSADASFKQGHQFLIGTSNGAVRISRGSDNIIDNNKESSIIRSYGSGDVGSSVSAVAFSPFSPKIFAIATGLNAVAIYEASSVEPLIFLASNKLTNVNTIRWSKTNPILLHSLYNNNQMAQWKLDKPNNPESIHSLNSEHNHKIIDFDTWLDDRGFSFMALITDSNQVIVHGLERSLNTRTQSLDDLLAKLQF
ncbi:unnamed protein product [Bursaphelenchus xylophilus]|uniref:(pine wood nematode) hypothetical protein n=1 Tax=Bursaphelenchus xylophilus TaxID=6326 RepID=A0A1I7SS40_BURXY|nr:unnamed protein product [Bursaphelenchus xylophilus]CAG9105709.1 unnamed protein product [Bursaphelenchus xylophilus]